MNKKNYISPVLSVHNVSPCAGILQSISGATGTPGEEAETKEQKTGSAGMWDLYNN